MQFNPDPTQVPQGEQRSPVFQNTEANRISTNTPDPHFDLVSVLYHALEGAQTYAQYVEDANRTGDQELAQFFSQAQQYQISCADTAKQLLGRRLTRSSAH